MWTVVLVKIYKNNTLYLALAVKSANHVCYQLAQSYLAFIFLIYFLSILTRFSADKKLALYPWQVLYYYDNVAIVQVGQIIHGIMHNRLSLCGLTLAHTIISGADDQHLRKHTWVGRTA